MLPVERELREPIIKSRRGEKRLIGTGASSFCSISTRSSRKRSRIVRVPFEGTYKFRRSEFGWLWILPGSNVIRALICILLFQSDRERKKKRRRLSERTKLAKIYFTRYTFTWHHFCVLSIIYSKNYSLSFVIIIEMIHHTIFYIFSD